MGLNPRWIKLGRLFAVAWLSFYVFPLAVILGGGFSLQTKVSALALLAGSAGVWAWFWTRVIGGLDGRFKLVALALESLLIGAFTLLTPAAYGSLFVYVVLLAGAAVGWRMAIPLVLLAAVAGGALDLIRGVGTFQAVGGVINDTIVGLSAVAGRLLIEANQQLLRARGQIARLAVGEERLRFARDLHDLIGHSLSVIALKSELAGRLINRAPELAAHEVQEIEKVARDALREVREAVTDYRQPTLAAELAGAREAMEAAGIDCRIEQQASGLPAAVESVLAWTVREGATNVMRHSRATRCSIRIFQNDGYARLDVIDDGQGGTPEPGSGLRGLEERIRERGGTLRAEPLPHEGFRLRVSLPLAPGPLPVNPPAGQEVVR
jgi:two-component system, NarL family, sensor histidine kinase DesK